MKAASRAPSRAKKTYEMKVRLTETDRQTLEQAASSLGMNMAQHVRSVAIVDARRRTRTLADFVPSKVQR